MDTLTYLAKGRIKKAIESLPKEHSSNATIWMSRYNHNESQYALGVRKEEDYQHERNKLVTAITNQLSQKPSKKVPTLITKRYEVPDPVRITLEDAKALVEKTRRLNENHEDIDIMARRVLREYLDYQYESATVVGYDMAGSILKEIEQTFQLTLKEYEKIKKENREEVLANLRRVLLARVPSYENLKTALSLLQDLGVTLNIPLQDTVTSRATATDEIEAEFNLLLNS